MAAKTWYNGHEAQRSADRKTAVNADGDMIQRKHFLVKRGRYPIPGIPDAGPGQHGPGTAQEMCNRSVVAFSGTGSYNVY